MEKTEKYVRIAHVVINALNFGTILFALMNLSVGTVLYAFFRGLSLAFSFPILLMRSIYLQYIVFGILALFTIIKYFFMVTNKTVLKKDIIIDFILWGITIVELIYTESAYLAILWF